ncbi:MAG: DUF1800 domain-containing protein, partial [Gemmatimonadota bacterium]|nr:DUF1800 domain-containing protein [Gemmatimonadota bacterium]
MRLIARLPAITLALTAAACSSNHAGAARVASASASGDVAQGTREQTADEQVKQALNRVGFGARPGDAERVRAMGVDKWIELQLAPQKIDDRATEQFVSRFPVLAMSPAELLKEYPQQQQLIREKRQEMARNGDALRAQMRDSARGRL